MEMLLQHKRKHTTFNLIQAWGASRSSHSNSLPNARDLKIRVPFEHVYSVLKLFRGSRSCTGTQRLEIHDGLEYLVHVAAHKSRPLMWMRRKDRRGVVCHVTKCFLCSLPPGHAFLSMSPPRWAVPIVAPTSLRAGWGCSHSFPKKSEYKTFPPFPPLLLHFPIYPPQR